MRRLELTLPALLLMLLSLACSEPARQYDVLVRGGTLYDGTGSPGRPGDLAITGDRIVAIGDLPKNARAVTVIDASGLAVCPGFINMLSWANESLIEDGRSMSDIMQGVTLEVMGEGESMGPLNDTMKPSLAARQFDIHYDITWTTLGEYLEFLEQRGVSCNVASFIGAATPRVYVLGYEDRPPTAEELERMCALVEQAMQEGAMGVASSLIYAPGFYAKTDELIALSRVAASYGGMYISHIRNESYSLLEAIEEFFTIVRESGIRGEIYHLKAAGEDNWTKLEAVIERMEAARSEGLHVTADIYPYTAASTGLDAAMPPWVQEGGHDEWIKRLKDPQIRRKVASEIQQRGIGWENFFHLAGPEGCLVVGLKQDSLKVLTGRTLAEIAALWNLPPAQAVMDLVVKDDSRVQMVYFVMSEENIRRKIGLPWVSIGSDMESSAPEGVFLKSSTHPRAYGSFARVLAKYVRDEKVITLEEAVRRMSGLPAENLGLADRGRLAVNNYADVVVFDPAKVQDHATFEKPMQLATGVTHVVVNGVPVVADGRHTGAKPGRFVRGPGYRPARAH